MTMNDSNLEEQTQRYRPYDWRPFFRAVAKALYEIGQNAETRDQQIREKAEAIFDAGHGILKDEYLFIDPFSFIYTLARTPHADAPTFERLCIAHTALNLDKDVDPKCITDFEYPHPTHLTLFHSDGGSYIQKEEAGAKVDEQAALNGVWDLFSTIYGAPDHTVMTDEMFREALQRPNFGLANLTQTMFLINPDVFLPIDDRMLWLPLFPEVADILGKQLAQVKMCNFIKNRQNTFGGIMQTIIEAFPGCKPYEINLFAWSLATERLFLNDTWQISSFAGGANAEDYFFTDGKDGGWNFRENSCVWAGKGRDEDPHLKEPKKGDVIVVRKGNTMQAQAQRVHALAVVWRNNYQDDDQVKAGNDVIFVIYVRVEDVKPHDYDVNFTPPAFSRHNQGISFYPQTQDLLNAIRAKQHGEKPELEKKIDPQCQEYQEYINLLKANHNLVLTGAPGTGKTYIAKRIASCLLNADIDKDPEALNKSDRYDFVQFHPSYDYTDFVEGLRPVKNTQKDTIGFELKDGIFKAFCERAMQQPSDKFVFVIDEINRGEISKIFGELFFSIDPGYRGPKGAVKTQYANLHNNREGDEEVETTANSFYVPKNVFIIGTMNNIDRSVESIDFAMRRRFAWKNIGYEETIGMLDGESGLGDDATSAKKRLHHLNKAIFSKEQDGNEGQGGIEGLSADYHIGAAYMLKIEVYAGDDKRWQSLWEYHLAPLLREYLRGLPDGTQKLTELKTAYNKTT